MHKGAKGLKKGFRDDSSTNQKAKGNKIGQQNEDMHLLFRRAENQIAIERRPLESMGLTVEEQRRYPQLVGADALGKIQKVPAQETHRAVDIEEASEKAAEWMRDHLDKNPKGKVIWHFKRLAMDERHYAQTWLENEEFFAKKKAEN